jgi:hypothetical protein
VTSVALVCLWLALVVWVGEVVFLSLVAAPGLFAALPRETAGQAVGALFPAYYAIGAAAGAVAVGAAAWLWRGAPRSARWGALTIMLGLMLAATLYAGAVVHPRARALRPALHAAAEGGARAEFERLHRLAVSLNVGVLLLGLASVCIGASGLRLRDGRGS